MKDIAKIKTVLVFVGLLICNLCFYSPLSSQNLLMPIPSGEVMDFAGCGIGGNISLPIGYDPTPCNPQDESSLEAFYGFTSQLTADLNEFYIGQYPKFCQQVVHDSRGNILFFIVDNNIYNKNGVGFENPNPNYDFWLLHPLPIISEANELNRFQTNFTLKPEISIVPVPQSNPDDCDLKFYIFYAINKYIGTRQAVYNVTHFVRMLTYGNENTIDLTAPQIILDDVGMVSLGANHMTGTMSCGITEYNETNDEYMYFIQGGGYFFIYQVTDIIGNIVLANAKVYFDNTCLNRTYDDLHTELEICKPLNQNYYLVAYPLYSKHFATLKVVDNFSSITETSFGPFYTANIHSFAASNLTGIIDYNLVVEGINDIPAGEWNHTFVGMEFTSNGDYLYMTQEGFTGFKCYDLASNILYRYPTLSYDFSHSHIELGKNNIMYFGNTTYIPPTGDFTNIVGNLITLSNPETPGIVLGNPLLSNNNLTSTSTPLSGSILDFAGSIFYPHFDFSDQVDGFEFSDYYTTIDKVFVIDEFPLTLSANEVWSPGCTNNPFGSIDGNVYLIDDVTIPMGKRIEIQNMTFHFPDGTHMYLEAGNPDNYGAYLKLNNTTFTSLHSCGEVEDFWGGLVLNGDISQPQGSYNTSKQPVVYMINSSKIENAETGIYAKHGGIVVANTCSFENNIRAVKFDDFQNKTNNGLHDMINKSIFSKCEFTVNDDFLGIDLSTPIYFQEHAYLHKVDGIKFTACSFDNQQTLVSYNASNNYGINAAMAGFYVDCLCDMGGLPLGQECPVDNKISSTFDKLKIAVKVEDGTKAVSIRNSEFTNNIVGITIHDLDYPVITRNDFVIGGTDIIGTPNNGLPHIIAIRTEISTGFQIEENTIGKADVTNPAWETYGIIIQKSENENNEVYNNDIDDIEIAMNLLDDNRDENDAFNGLVIRCNNFTDITDYDINVNIYDNTAQQSGIREYQGTINPPIAAGNCFTLNIPTAEGNIFNGTNNHIAYYYYGPPDASNCYYPFEFTPNLVSVNPQSTNNTCASHLSQGFVPGMDPSVEATAQLNYFTVKTAYYNLLYSYYQQMDGGNTPAVLQQIQSTWPQEAWDLRNDLMAMAPFVSREALEEAANMGILPDAMLLEICLANPDATRSDEFLNFLANGIPNPLPQYMIEMIQANWDLVTSRTLLESNLAYYGGERDFYAKVLIANERFKDEYHLTDLKTWHEDRANLSDYYSLAELYMERNYFDSAEMVLDDIVIDFELSENQVIGHNNYNDYYEFMLALHNNNKTIHDLDSLEILALQSIADEPLGFAAGKARGILCFAYNICESDYGHVTEAQPKSARAPQPDPYKLIHDFYNKLTVSPNPANEFTVITYELPLLETEAQLRISDISGKVVEILSIDGKVGTRIWDTHKTAEGIYLLEVISNGTQITNTKLVITK